MMQSGPNAYLLSSAKNKSKNHNRGDVYDKDVNMNAAYFYEAIKVRLFPVLKARFPWAKRIIVQCDNAPPHVGKKTIERLNTVGETLLPKLEVITQSPKSPDMNVLDLYIVHSWARRNHKFQKFTAAGDIEGLVANVWKTWGEYPQETIERAFQNLSLVYRKCIELKGGNHFEIPHLTPGERAKLPGFLQF